MRKLLIIGVDSFIAKEFIKKYSSKFKIFGYSRRQVDYCQYHLSSDFLDISNSHFNWADVVINFAAIVHQPKQTDPLLYEKVNVFLPISLAEKAKNNGVSQFIQMSTISVYGTVNVISIDTPESPDNLYGNTKLAADTKLMEFRSNTFEISILRPPMVYGGVGAPGNMKSLIGLLRKNIPLPFKGINNKRDFINIQNLVQYLAITIINRVGGIILISDAQPVSTEYLCKIILKYLGRKGMLVKIPRIILRFIKAIWPEKYKKLYGTLTVKTNFQYEKLINRSTVEEGIKNMIIDK